MKAKVILNPYANRWKAKERGNDITTALQITGLDFDLVTTNAPEHGTELAATAVAEGYDVVIAAGGDGTINEVLNGILQATPNGQTIPFGIMPAGSANDFCHQIGIPSDLTAAAKIIAAGQTRLLDAGKVNGHYFLNNSAVGMEPVVTIESQKIKRLSGESRYIAALIKALIKLKAWQMEIHWDDGDFTGPGYFLSVCNGPRTGGFLMAPGAEMDDGYFDFVFAPEMPKLKLISALLKLFKGTHVELPYITFERTKKLTMTCTPGTPIHADGEIIDRTATAVTYEIIPAKVNLLLS